MKRTMIVLLAIVASLVVLFNACKDENATTPESGEAVLSGVVTDNATGAAINGVQVIAHAPGGNQGTTTNENGSFSFTFPVDSTGTIFVSFSKAGYQDTTVSAHIESGTLTQISIRLVPTGPATIIGVVKDVATGVPLNNIKVRTFSLTIDPETTYTNAEGVFSFTFPIDSTAPNATASVMLVLNVPGYRDTTIAVQLRFGVVTSLQIRLAARIGGTVGGGIAQTIAFLGADPQELSVYGVGGVETATLNWEVRDSLGQAINDQHAVDLHFSVLGNLNGGEYVSPQVVTTSATGRATTTFNSGIRSGVVQIEARTTVGARTITSSPVRVIIRAGFADQTHFSVAPERHNFPALGILGLTDPITVLAGDRYSNPVAENTAVYFQSHAGVIQASVFTNADGMGSANLISGNPAPFGIYAASQFGDGYHYVIARTIGEGGVQIQDSTLLLWSGASLIDSVTPATFNIQNGGSQNFAFKVSDYLNHPLAAGTTITVRASSTNTLQLGFGNGGSVTLEDFLLPGEGTTIFRFQLSDGDITDSTLAAVSVSINVTGPNGNAYSNIGGTCR